MDRDEMKKARNAERGTRNEDDARSEEHSEHRPPTSDLASFEALLSSLAPRAAGIDRDRLMFLAGQAAALPLPLGEGRGEGIRGDEGDAPYGAPSAQAAAQDSAALILTLSQTEREPRGRWAWPAALSAMTALAASLLVALVNRPEPRVIERIVRVPVERPAVVADSPLIERDQPARESGLAFSPARPDAAFGESYLHARDQVLAFGLDSWISSNPSAAASGNQPPASYRELRESLLQ